MRHSRRLIFQLPEVSVPRRPFQGVLDRIGRLSPGAKLREVTYTILPRGGERSRESACLQCAFTPLAGDLKTSKTDKMHGSRQESHPLSERPAIEWPCRT